MGYVIIILLMSSIAALIYLEAALKGALHFLQSLPFIRAIPFEYTAHLILFLGISSVFYIINKKYENYKKKQEDLKPKAGYIYIYGNKFYEDERGRVYDSFETYKKYAIAEGMEIERERRELTERQRREEEEIKKKKNQW